MSFTLRLPSGQAVSVKQGRQKRSHQGTGHNFKTQPFPVAENLGVGHVPPTCTLCISFSGCEIEQETLVKAVTVPREPGDFCWQR